MTVMIDALKKVEQAWHKKFALENDSLATIRQQAMQNFLVKGLPTSKDEQWKYTNIAPVANHLTCFSSPNNDLDAEMIQSNLLREHHCQLVFVDGFFVSHLSTMPSGNNYVIKSLAETIDEGDIANYLKETSSSSTFSHLNTACLTDGILIHFKGNATIKPIHLLFLASDRAKDSLHTVRNVIVVDRDTRLHIFEDHQSLTGEAYTMNVVTQIFAAENACVEYTKLQNQNTHSYHIGSIEIAQQQNSRVLMHHYNLGSALAREEIHCWLNEKDAKFSMQGLYLPLFKQHLDVQSVIHHLADNTESEELFKGVIASKSKAVFNGTIHVAKNIKRAVANLQNKNLLLARDAEVYTKPELEIYADDVKCKHGATVGQVDAEMLFYLRSRGITHDKAYQLLLLAFVREHLNVISNSWINEKIISVVSNYCEEIFNE